MSRIDLAGRLGHTRARVAAETPAAPRATAKFAEMTRKDARIRPDQDAALTLLAEELMVRRSVKTERLTENTLIRVAIDLLLAHADQLRGSTEDDLRHSVTSHLAPPRSSELPHSRTTELAHSGSGAVGAVRTPEIAQVRASELPQCRTSELPDSRSPAMADSGTSDSPELDDSEGRADGPNVPRRPRTSATALETAPPSFVATSGGEVGVW